MAEGINLLTLKKARQSSYREVADRELPKLGLAAHWSAKELMLEDQSPVALWPDVSGNNRHATQASAGKQPIFCQNAYGSGLHTVRFSPDDLHELAVNEGGGLFQNIEGATIFVVMSRKQPDDGARRYVFFASTGTSYNSSRLSIGGETYLRTVTRRLDGDSSSLQHTEGGLASLDASRLQLFTCRIRYSDAVVQHWLNNVLVHTGSADWGPGVTSDTPPRAVAIGMAPGGVGSAQYWDGDIAELLIYNRALDDVEVDRVSAHLLHDWCIKAPTLKGRKAIFSTVSIADITKETYPVLAAVKQSNLNRAASPVPVGYLYYKYGTNEVLYSAGRPDAPEPLFTWDSALADGSGPEDYQPFVTAEGDVIWVVRGELLNGERRNPIVYPAGNYDAPVLVDLGENPKPTCWLQNSGIDQDYGHSGGLIMFGEYTRPQHAAAYVWRVTKPYTSASSWERVLERPVGVDGFEHFHTSNYDPFSDTWLVTSGDADTAVSVLISRDDGNTWEEVAGGSQMYRVLNYVFTESAVYWSSDSIGYASGLYRVLRDAETGVPDFTSIERLTPLNRESSTYVTCLCHSPAGILVLPHNDHGRFAQIDVWFWDFNDERLHRIAVVERIGGPGMFGFRCQATTLYQPPQGPIMCGFGKTYENQIKIFGNGAENMVRNMGIAIV